MDASETTHEYRKRIDAEMVLARNFFSWLPSSDQKETYIRSLAESFAGIRQEGVNPDAEVTISQVQYLTVDGAPFPINCTACKKPLLLCNLFVDDGCPCNSPRGVNFKLSTCGLCRADDCVKPAHHLSTLFGDSMPTGYLRATKSLITAKKDAVVHALKLAKAQALEGGCSCHFASCPHDEAGKVIAHRIQTMIDGYLK